ncbi:hypothetical protein TI05_09145 [Achromatium sp. WMS3]|nr:hypothetical protein TI05_09145 [Achromatium sp. WMS3]
MKKLFSNETKLIDPLDKIQDQSIKDMIISMRKIRGTQLNKLDHNLTDQALFLEGLKQSGKYNL